MTPGQLSPTHKPQKPFIVADSQLQPEELSVAGSQLQLALQPLGPLSRPEISSWLQYSQNVLLSHRRPTTDARNEFALTLRKPQPTPMTLWNPILSSKCYITKGTLNTRSTSLPPTPKEAFSMAKPSRHAAGSYRPGVGAVGLLLCSPRLNTGGS